MISIKFVQIPVDISENLQRLVHEAARQGGATIREGVAGITHRQWYDMSEEIVSGYLSEKGRPRQQGKNIEDIQILTKLFQVVTGDMKWAVSHFNYHLLLGRDPDLSEVIWHLVDEIHWVPATARKLIQVVNNIVKETKQDRLAIYGAVLEQIDLDKPGLWASQKVNAIYESFQIKKFQPERRHRAPSLKGLPASGQADIETFYEQGRIVLDTLIENAPVDAMTRQDFMHDLDIMVRRWHAFFQTAKAAKTTDDRMRCMQGLRDLHLPPGTSLAEAKKSYHRLAFQAHPDRNPGNPEADKQFKLYTSAINAVTKYLSEGSVQ